MHHPIPKPDFLQQGRAHPHLRARLLGNFAVQLQILRLCLLELLAAEKLLPFALLRAQHRLPGRALAGGIGRGGEKLLRRHDRKGGDDVARLRVHEVGGLDGGRCRGLLEERGRFVRVDVVLRLGGTRVRFWVPN